MAQLQRTDDITRAKQRIGRQAQPLDLTKAFDGITALMSCKYPLISHARATGPCVIGQNFLAHSALTPVSATYPLANITPWTRLVLITEAKKRAGIKDEALSLNTEYDMVLKDITGRYDLLRCMYATGTFTAHATNNFLDVAGLDFKKSNHMKAGTNRTEVVPLDSELFWAHPLSSGAGLIADKLFYSQPEARIYGNPWSSVGSVTYYHWYTKFHPVASGDAYQHVLGDEFDETIILGLAAYACEAIGAGAKAKYWRMMFEDDLRAKVAFMATRREKFLYAGSEIEWVEPELFFTQYTAVNGTPRKWTWTWIDGAAANAKFWMYPPPDATGTATSVYSIGNPNANGADPNTYLHLMGETLDEAVIRGLCWKGHEMIQSYEWAQYWKSMFEFELLSKAKEILERVHVPPNIGSYAVT